MSFKITLSLFAVAAALACGTATAASTPAGLRADGLRWQAMADFYSQQAAARGLKADGLRWMAKAKFYSQKAHARERASAQPQLSTTSTGGFDWGDAGVGAAGGFALALCVAVLIAVALRTREAKVA